MTPLGPATVEATWDRAAGVLRAGAVTVSVGRGGRALDNAAAAMAAAVRATGARPRRIAVRDARGVVRIVHHLPPDPAQQPREESTMAKKDRLTNGGGDPGPGHNGLSPDSFITLALDVSKAKRGMDEAVAKHRNARKRLESAGYDMKAFALLEGLLKLDDDEARGRIRSLFRMASWMDRPLGEQGDLFGDADGPSQKARDARADAEAEEEGYRAGLGGRAADDHRFPQGTPLAAAWGRGWATGDAARKAVGADDAPPAPTAATGTRRPGRRGRAAEAGASEKDAAREDGADAESEVEADRPAAVAAERALAESRPHLN